MKIKNTSMEKIISAIEFKDLFRYIDKPPEITAAGMVRGNFYLMINTSYLIPLDLETLKIVIKEVEENKCYVRK